MRGSGSPPEESGNEVTVDWGSAGAGTGAGMYGVESDSCLGAPVSRESRRLREIGAWMVGGGTSG
eukprot:1499389-Pleurochrysis_carterae.AAC.2